MDQKYLDQVPKKLGTVGKFDFNLNVAPWNIANYNLGFKEDIFYVNEKKLSMYHFQNLQHLIKIIIIAHLVNMGLKKIIKYYQNIL